MKEDAFEDRLNALLDEEHQVSPGLERRILANLPANDGLQRVFAWAVTSFARLAAAAAIPLVLGFAVGFGQDTGTAAFDEDVVTLAFAESFEDWNHE